MGKVVILTIITKKKWLTIKKKWSLPSHGCCYHLYFLQIYNQSLFSSSENKSVKQRRINTVDFILVVMAGGFVSSFLREVQSTIDQVVLTHVSSYKPASYPCHAPGMPLTTLKKRNFYTPSKRQR